MRLKKKIEALESMVLKLETTVSNLGDTRLKLRRLEEFLGYSVQHLVIPEDFNGTVVELEKMLTWEGAVGARCVGIKPDGYLHRLELLLDELGYEYQPKLAMEPKLKKEK